MSAALLGRRALAPLLLLVAACTSAPRPAASPKPAEVRETRAADLRDTRALLLLMADQKRFEEGVFVALLDGSESVRRDLAVALGRIGDPRGRGILQGLLIDAQPTVRRAAAFALGELGLPESTPALLRAAVDDDSATGLLAVEALGKVHAPLADVRRTLSAIESAEAARRLAPALFRFQDDGRVDAALELLSSVEFEVHAGAAYALGREARASGLEALRRLLADPVPLVRSWAARGLGEVGEVGDLRALELLLAGTSSSPKIQALRAGAKILARVQALPPLDWGRLLVACMKDSLPGVRAAAIEAAAAWMHQDEVRAEVLRLAADGGLREQELALSKLASSEDPAAEAAVRRAMDSPEATLRKAAAEAAATLGLSDALDRLAGDPQPMVRVSVAERLLAGAAEEGAATDAEFADLGRRFLRDPDPIVRATVLEALVDRPALPAAELATALGRSEHDEPLDARLGALHALAARAAAVAAESEAAMGLLEAALEDREYLVRREASSALTRLGRPAGEIGAVTSARTGPVYAQILEQTDRPRTVQVVTDRGRFEIRLACPEAPLTCLSFVQLAGQGYFDGLRFHRVVPDFVVQTGDPRGDGWGGPGYSLRDEINPLRFGRGAVGMALSGPDTGGSQFFIALAPQPHLDGGYTVFGQVVGDDAVLDQIRQGDRMLSVREIENP